MKKIITYLILLLVAIGAVRKINSNKSRFIITYEPTLVYNREAQVLDIDFANVSSEGVICDLKIPELNVELKGIQSNTFIGGLEINMNAIRLPTYVTLEVSMRDLNRIGSTRTKKLDCIVVDYDTLTPQPSPLK